MENELDPVIIKATQTSLGKYVKKPPLTEKLLKKPPFRFLHDIVTTIIKTTGFFNGLFDEEELISDNVKDRDSKILFLNKVIFVLGTVTGNTLTIKPSKIVAGQEADKTNELLQLLAQTLDKKIKSDEAVKRYKQNVQKNDNKIKSESKLETVRVAKKNDDKKLTSTKSTDKLTTKKESFNKSLSKNDKTNANKTKQRDTKEALIKKEPPNKKVSQKKISGDTNKLNTEITNDKTGKVSNETESIAILRNSDKYLSKEEHVDNNFDENTKDVLQLGTIYRIDNELNSSLSSQDLMQVDNDKTDAELISDHSPASKELQIDRDGIEIIDKKVTTETTTELYTEGTPLEDSNKNIFKIDEVSSVDTKEELKDSIKPKKEEPTIRPLSVRPSSSRPGAPRIREKHENIVNDPEKLLLGKVNVIVETLTNEDEEDSSIIIIEQPIASPQGSGDHTEDVQLLTNQHHGHLVQQILESQKEFSQASGKTEIEWQFGAQKSREALHQEIDLLRFNIQALSRVANPLGKLLEHVQEDVEVMRQELEQWNKTYEDTSRELAKQKAANQGSLLPLHTKVKQFDSDIVEKRDKINDLKVIIHNNSSRIEKLLANGAVQY